MKIQAATRLRAYPYMDYETRLQKLCEMIDEPDWGPITASHRLRADGWSKEVSDKVGDKDRPPEGTFKGTSESIAKALKKIHGDNFQSAMSALNFYINRGGADLPNREAVEGAKDALRKLYGKE